MMEDIKNFKGKKVAVIGDIMLDRFLWGGNERLSPEAPVPVILIKDETVVPGGAANVAANIASLEGTPILLGVIGEDSQGAELCGALEKLNIEAAYIVRDGKRPTTEKTRIISHGQQVVRVDKEVSNAISQEAAETLLNTLSDHIEALDAIVISDYAKGVVSKRTLSLILDIGKKHNRPIIGDMKPQHIPLCTGITLLTSNRKEVSKAAGIEDLIEAGKSITSSLDCHLLVTRGEEGMSLFEKESVHHFPIYAKDVYDAAGAGDTVTATMALALSADIPLLDAAEIANHAAGVVVGKSGVATVSLEELEHSFRNNAQKN